MSKYCLVSGKWDRLAERRDERNIHSICALVDSIYLFGGAHHWQFDPCLEFDTRDREWREFSAMNEGRSSAACAVFNEAVVVCGGLGKSRAGLLRSAEAYEQADGCWTRMPSMVRARHDHRLFAVGWSSAEIFDGDRFAEIRWPLKRDQTSLQFQPVWVCGNSVLFLMRFGERVVARYDEDKNKWFEESFEETEGICYKTVLKIPQL